MTALTQDVRYALRTLARNPGFAAIAVLTLGLGIGSNAAIFSVVHAILLKPLPYEDPERLVAIWERNASIGKERDPVAPMNFQDWAAASAAWADLAAYRYASLALTDIDDPEQVPALSVSRNLFPVLGIEPQVGRSFTPDDEREQAPVVVLSHRLWQRRFGGDPGLVGRPIELDNRAYTVVGVMPPSFRFPPDETDVDAYVPLVFGRNELRSRRAHSLFVIGRLEPGVTVQQAADRLGAIARGIAETDPASNPEVTVVPAHDQLVENVRLGLVALCGSVGFVLLIACANVASLLLVRATTRRQEMAIRVSLGAGRARVMRQLLTESLVLAAIGGLAGVLLASWTTGLAARFSPASIPRIHEVTIDTIVLAFVTGLTVLTALLFGMVPAWQATRASFSEAIKGGGKGATLSPRSGLAGLAIAEISLSLVALAGAGLMIHSLIKLQRLDYGFVAEHLLTAQVFLPAAKYPTDPGQFRPPAVDAPAPPLSPQARFFEELERRVRALPGVESAAVVSALPLDEVGIDYDLPVVVVGRPPPRLGEEPQADFRIASAGYFRTMGIPLRQGRDFDEFDGPASAPVAIINETMARQFFPNQDPLRQRLQLYGRQREIVGVVGSVRHYGFGRGARPEMFVPSTQFQLGGMALVVRARVEPRSLVSAVKAQVHAIDPDQPVYRFQTMVQKVSASIAQPRFTTLLLTAFAALAACMAIVGTYGVVSYAVAQRRREIGVRMALGADRADVARMVLGQGLRLVAAGIILGLAGALGVTRLMEGLLYGVSATDPLTLATMGGLLELSAALAIAIPVRRGSRVDPAVALRYE